MEVNVRAARCFLVLAEERNFCHASQRLRMAQPHLTRMIQRLEQSFGVLLVDRSARPIVLTDAGRVFLDAGRKLVEAAEDCERRVVAFARPDHRALLVGIDQHALVEFSPLFSDKSITPRPFLPLSDEDPLEMLSHGRLHLALIRSRSSYGGLSASSVLTERYVLAVPSMSTPSEEDRPLSLNRMHRLVVAVDRHELRLCLTRQEADAVEIIKAVSFAEALTLASLGLGAAIVPTSYQRLKVSDVLFRDIAESIPPSEVVMAWRDGSVPEELLSGLRAWGRDS